MEYSVDKVDGLLATLLFLNMANPTASSHTEIYKSSFALGIGFFSTSGLGKNVLRLLKAV